MKNRPIFIAVDLAQIALFVALMCVFTRFVSIPFYPVPLTFQTVIAVLAGMLLGGVKGAIAMAVYMLMGLIGIPVFGSAPYGTFMYVLKPSFGYIVSFIFTALVAGLLCQKSTKWWEYCLAGCVGFVVNYLIGILYFIVVWQLNGYAGLWQALVGYNFLYMPKDLLLCVFASLLAWRVVPHIHTYRISSKKKAESV